LDKRNICNLSVFVHLGWLACMAAQWQRIYGRSFYGQKFVSYFSLCQSINQSVSQLVTIL